MPANTFNFLKDNREKVLIAMLALLVVAIYWQTVTFGFINLDDNAYVYENGFVLNGLSSESVRAAFTRFHSANWHPLTWISHQIDVTLFGLNPGGHHATSVLIHLINSLLTFAVFQRLTGSFSKSAVVAALFAVHPTHVESVAWVSERKDVLSTMFWLLTIFLYAGFVKGMRPPDSDTKESPQADGKPLLSGPQQAALAGVFALGLMAKPMLVTLPFVLLLLDYWPLKRFSGIRGILPLVKEKALLFLLSVGSAIITVYAQRSAEAVQSLSEIQPDVRVYNAVTSYGKYVLMLFYPVDLAVLYPYVLSIPVWQVTLSALFIAAVTVLAWRLRRELGYFLTGWLWFLGTLVPVIGLVQVGSQALADRYTYIPYLGLFLMLVWGIDDLRKRLRIPDTFIASLAVAAIIVLSALSFRYVSFWKGNETLFRHALSVTNHNFLLAQNYCFELSEQNRLIEAEKFCRDSIEANPRYAEAWNTLGQIQFKRGQFSEAVESFRKAAGLSPRFALFRVNLSSALSRAGNPSEAEAVLKEAAGMSSYRVRTDVWVSSLESLAAAYAEKGDDEKAAEHLSRALFISPESIEIRVNLVLILVRLKNIDGALGVVSDALQRQPNDAALYLLKARVLEEGGKQKEAEEAAQKALSLKPGLKEASDLLKRLKVKNQE